MLAQLVYVSRRSETLSPEIMWEIVAKSEKANRDRGISGAMLCCGSSIMQLLEGQPAEVERLFEKIAADARHRDVQCLLRKSIRRRLFPEWGMMLADLDRGAKISAERLTQLIEAVRANIDTGELTVEARILIADFKLQMDSA